MTRNTFYVSITSNPPGSMVGGAGTYYDLGKAVAAAEAEVARGLIAHIYDNGSRCQSCRGTGKGRRWFEPTHIGLGTWGHWHVEDCGDCDGTGRIDARGQILTLGA